MSRHCSAPSIRSIAAIVRRFAREGDAALAHRDPGRLMRPEAVTEAHWPLHQQPRDAWTFELDIRPFGERW